MEFSKKLEVAIRLSAGSVLVANGILSLGDRTELVIYGASYWASVAMRFIILLCICGFAEKDTSSSFHDFVCVDVPVIVGLAIISPVLDISVEYKWWVNLILLSLPFVIMACVASFVGPHKKEKKK